MNKIWILGILAIASLVIADGTISASVLDTGVSSLATTLNAPTVAYANNQDVFKETITIQTNGISYVVFKSDGFEHDAYTLTDGVTTCTISDAYNLGCKFATPSNGSETLTITATSKPIPSSYIDGDYVSIIYAQGLASDNSLIGFEQIASSTKHVSLPTITVTSIEAVKNTAYATGADYFTFRFHLTAYGENKAQISLQDFLLSTDSSIKIPTDSATQTNGVSTLQNSKTADETKAFNFGSYVQGIANSGTVEITVIVPKFVPAGLYSANYQVYGWLG